MPPPLPPPSAAVMLMNNQEAPTSSPPGGGGPSVSRRYTGQVKQSVSCILSVSRKGTIVA